MVDGQCVESSVGIVCSGGCLEFVQAVRNEEYAVNENSIGGSFDLKVSKEGVCAEKVEDLINYVVIFVSRIGGTSELCSNWQNGEVSNQTSVSTCRKECGVICLVWVRWELRIMAGYLQA
jgi:hypothetical protein